MDDIETYLPSDGITLRLSKIFVSGFENTIVEEITVETIGRGKIYIINFRIPNIALTGKFYGWRGIISASGDLKGNLG